MADIRAVIDTIKNAVDLRDLMAADAKKSAGETFIPCPFHTDDTPSCHVRREYFYCFGCGASGDIISYYQRQGYDFLEALRIAALDANIPLEDGLESQISKLSEERNKRNEDLAHYRKKLDDSDKAMAYLTTTRGLTEETIKHFGLGYNPERQAIAIPMIGRGGQVESISFRFLDPNNTQRYEHRNTSTWTKGNHLYNVRSLEFETGPIHVCEGMFDAMSLWQLGYKRTVAIMGGMLTDNHVKQFGGSPVIIIPDRKKPGDYELFKQSVFRLRRAHQDLTIRVAFLPDGDANSCEPEVVKAAIEGAKGAELAILQADLDACLDRDAEYKLARKIALDITDALTKDDIIRWLAFRWDKAIEVVRQALSRSDSMALSRVVTMADALDELELSERTAVDSGLGIVGLGMDKYIDRPRTGHICIIAARPAVGKTLTALNILYNNAVHQVPTLYVTQEQPPKELAYRLCLMLGGDTTAIDNPTLRHNILHDTDWWKQHRKQLEQLLPHVRFESRRVSPLTMRDAIIDNSYSMGQQVKVVVIDYLGLLRTDQRTNTAYEQASHIARDVQEVTRELDFFNVSLLQVTREGKKGDERVTLDMGRDSGVNEEIADYFVGLWLSKEDYTEHGVQRLEGSVCKNRHGQSGDFTLWKHMQTLRLFTTDHAGDGKHTTNRQEKDDSTVDPWGA